MEPFDLRKWKGFAGDTSFPAMIEQITIDSRRVNHKNSLFIPLPGEQTDGHHFIEHAASKGARYALAKPGWKHPENLHVINVEDPLQAFQEIVAVYRGQFSCEVVAIGGSYGKTMVKDLLVEILSSNFQVVSSPESFNSQIGVPLSLLQIEKKHEIALIEAGISQVGEMERLVKMIDPTSAIITQIGRKHLATLGSLETVKNEVLSLLKKPLKWSLVFSQTSPEYPHVSMIPDPHSPKYSVVFPDGEAHENQMSEGHHYLIDMLNMGVKAAWLLGSSKKAICDTLSRYHPEPMRTEIWPTPFGSTIINEAYCADPQSIDRALKHFERAHPQGKKIFVFGGIRNSSSKKIEPPPQIDVVTLENRTIEETLKHITMKPHDTILIKGARKIPFNTVFESVQGGHPTNQCVINLAAIDTNLQLLRNKLPLKTRIMMMVKASSYGTHETIIPKFLASRGVDLFGVSYVDEAISLRRAGISQDIFVLNASFHEIPKVIEHGLEIGVNDEELILALAQQKKRIRVHLHIDTGMSRLGCRPEEALLLARMIKKNPHLQLEGIMTHFACADDPTQDAFTKQQIQIFDHVIKELAEDEIHPPWKHAANSSGAIRFSFPQYNMVRIGLAMYGLTPSKAVREQLDLRLAISLTSKIVGINIGKKGETVSYGRNHTITKDMNRIAVIPIGYFDGLHRNYSGKGYVLIRGKKAPMIGNICMDYMMVDIDAIPEARIGDSVLIFGEDERGYLLPPEDFAEMGNSISHELIACLGPRIQRLFIHEENARSC